MTISTTTMTPTWIGITEMTIEVIGKRPPPTYITVCTDVNCRAVLKFDHDDIGFNKTFSMGREVDNHEGIVCPLCNQVLKKKDFQVSHPQTYGEAK